MRNGDLRWKCSIFRSPMTAIEHFWLSAGPDDIESTVSRAWHWCTWGRPMVKWGGMALAALSLSLSLLMAGPALGAPLQENEVRKFEWNYSGFKFLAEYDQKAGELKLSLDEIQGQIAVVEGENLGFEVTIDGDHYGILGESGTNAAEAVAYLARNLMSIKELRERVPGDPRQELDQWVKDHAFEP